MLSVTCRKTAVSGLPVESWWYSGPFYIQLCREFTRLRNPYAFLSAQFTTEDSDIPFGDGKLFRQKLDQVSIGPTIYRWCSNTNFNTVTVHTDNFIFGGFGLQVTAKQEVALLPLVKTHQTRNGAS
mgnify:CR=1 FL=1